MAKQADRVGALVCARTSSSRLPRKALIGISGKESIALVIERAKHCRSCRGVILCTTESADDDELAAIGMREGIEVYRGPRDNVALRMLGAARRFNLATAVRLTGDNLLWSADLCDCAVEVHLHEGADYTCIEGVFPGGGTEVVQADALQTVAERAVRKENTEYLSWYLDRPELFKVKRLMADSRYRRDYRLTLDTPEDLEVLRAVYAGLYSPGRPVDTVRALTWLDEHPEIGRINRHIQPKVRRSELDLEMSP